MVTMTAQQKIDLPKNGIRTRADFEALPQVPRGWAWELRSGHLELTHMPVSYWHWQVIMAVLEYWRRLGHAVAGEQRVADSGFMRGGTTRNNFVADGVAFRLGHTPSNPKMGTHDAADLYAVIEAVSEDSEERDAVEKRAVYAQLGIPHYWIIREKPPLAEGDGLISVHELAGSEYKLVGQRLVSQLKDFAGPVE